MFLIGIIILSRVVANEKKEFRDDVDFDLSSDLEEYFKIKLFFFKWGPPSLLQKRNLP